MFENVIYLTHLLHYFLSLRIHIVCNTLSAFFSQLTHWRNYLKWCHCSFWPIYWAFLSIIYMGVTSTLYTAAACPFTSSFFLSLSLSRMPWLPRTQTQFANELLDSFGWLFVELISEYLSSARTQDQQQQQHQDQHQHHKQQQQQHVLALCLYVCLCVWGYLYS